MLECPGKVVMPELKIAGTGSSSFNEAGITPPPYSLRTSLFGVNAAELHGWRPDVEVRRDKDKLLVRAVLPGLRMEDVKVTVTGDLLEIENGTLQANRNFYRAIPMPDGANTRQAVASFENGALDIAIPVTEPTIETIDIPIRR